MRTQPQFARAAVGIVGIAVLAATTAAGAGQKLEFEVASIRSTAQPLDGRRCGRTSTTDAARVERGCTSLEEILRIEIGIPKTRLVAPDWVGQGDHKFDISAKLPDGATKEQIPQMFQSLLEDRFGLVFHRESRERPIQALVAAKGGLEVRPAAPESAQPAWVAAAANVPAASRRLAAGTRMSTFTAGFGWRTNEHSPKPEHGFRVEVRAKRGENDTF